MLCQGRLRTACHRHQGHALAFEHRQDGGQLIAFAAVGNGQHQIDFFDHAQVAMAGFCGVHKHGGRAGGGEVAAIFRPT